LIRKLAQEDKKDGKGGLKSCGQPFPILYAVFTDYVLFLVRNKAILRVSLANSVIGQLAFWLFCYPPTFYIFKGSYHESKY